LPVALGMALGARIQKKSFHTFVMIGDGELHEGSNWEGALAAAHYKLSNLTAIIDHNKICQSGRVNEVISVDPLADKWRAFGWDVVELDGHDHGALWAAFTAAPSGKPRCVIARTIKGKGVSFMEDRVEWHHKVPTPEQVEQALAELAR